MDFGTVFSLQAYSCNFGAEWQVFVSAEMAPGDTEKASCTAAVPRNAVSSTNGEGPSAAWICGALCDQGVKIDPEEGHERPQDNRREAFQNVAGNVPCHEITMGGGDHNPDDQIHDPDQTYSASAHLAPAKSAYHRSSPAAGCVNQIIVAPGAFGEARASSGLLFRGTI